MLALTESTATVYAHVRTALKRLDTPIPANDAWIAAMALQHDLPILTRDEHFDAVPGVRRDSW